MEQRRPVENAVPSLLSAFRDGAQWPMHPSYYAQARAPHVKIGHVSWHGRVRRLFGCIMHLLLSSYPLQYHEDAKARALRGATV